MRSLADSVVISLRIKTANQRGHKQLILVHISVTWSHLSDLMKECLVRIFQANVGPIPIYTINSFVDCSCRSLSGGRLASGLSGGRHRFRQIADRPMHIPFTVQRLGLEQHFRIKQEVHHCIDRLVLLISDFIQSVSTGKADEQVGVCSR